MRTINVINHCSPVTILKNPQYRTSTDPCDTSAITDPTPGFMWSGDVLIVIAYIRPFFSYIVLQRGELHTAARHSSQRTSQLFRFSTSFNPHVFAPIKTAILQCQWLTKSDIGLPPSLTIDPVNRQALFTAIFFLDLTMERLRYRAS